MSLEFLDEGRCKWGPVNGKHLNWRIGDLKGRNTMVLHSLLFNLL